MIDGIIKEAIFGIVTLLIIFLIAGKSEVLFSTQGLGFAFKKSWWLLTIPVLLAVFLIIAAVFGNRPLVANALGMFFLTFLDAFTTGIYEESLMRGLVFNALLTKEGKNYSGIFTAIIISSLIFGFVHVASDFFSSFPNISLPDALQMIGKTLESGMMGFLMAAIYIRNHNLWSVIIIHFVNDFIMMLPLNMFSLEHQSGYVQSGSTSNGLIYYVMSVLSIPFIITAIKIVKNTSLPQFGSLKEKWYPLSVDENTKKSYM